MSKEKRESMQNPEAEQAVDNLRLKQLETGAELTQAEIREAVFERRKAKERARQAERSAGIWKAVAAGAVCAAVLVEIVAISAVRAQANPPASAKTHAAPVVQVLPLDTASSIEANENEQIEAALLERAVRLEDVTVTYYDPCVECCGKTDGITASGVQVTPYVTCAVDPAVIPLGSDVLMDYGDGELHYLRAEDVGGAVRGKHIDVCVTSHEEALESGRRTAVAYVVEEN